MSLGYGLSTRVVYAKNKRTLDEQACSYAMVIKKPGDQRLDVDSSGLFCFSQWGEVSW
jgi:hypothetical protein